MQNMHGGFCLVIIFFCSSSHSKGWMGKVLNCIKKKRTEWALCRWHKSRGESTINVNAFCVTSTSLIRPHLLLSTKSVNRFLCSLIDWTYLLPVITLKGFFCPWDVSLSVARPDPSLPLLILLFLFLRPCLDQPSRDVLEVLKDIFDCELHLNLPCALKGEEVLFGTFFPFLLSYIFILSLPIELMYSTGSRAAHRTCMPVLYLSKSALPYESGYCS